MRLVKVLDPTTNELIHYQIHDMADNELTDHYEFSHFSGKTHEFLLKRYRCYVDHDIRTIHQLVKQWITGLMSVPVIVSVATPISILKDTRNNKTTSRVSYASTYFNFVFILTEQQMIASIIAGFFVLPIGDQAFAMSLFDIEEEYFYG